MCDHFLSPKSRDYRVSTGELMAIGSGEIAQAVHRDADSWYHMPSPRPDLLMSANFALTDFTEDNGATVVVPGSHRWQDRSRQPRESERAKATMPRGSVLLYHGDVIHGGGANQTDETRIGLYLGYILSWLRPIENHYVTSGIDAIKAAPERARLMLDYTEDGFTVIA
jgi:ectoine hydroxylase-related dioxygenase (phytanoyl-CoA dioxygenase family)